MLVHGFNHRLEPAIKDAFTGTFFDEIDVMLRKNFYLTKIVLRNYLISKNLEEYLEKTLQKPSKSTGPRWIAQKVRALEVILANYGIFMAHIEYLS